MTLELVDETIDLGALTLQIQRPPNPGDLIDEARFAEDEYMPYWAELWSAGVALARYLVAKKHLKGLRVLELGAGLGLPSLAAALGGARVTATDWADDAMEMLAENAARNGAEVEAVVSDWRESAELVARGPWDLVLAADVLYEDRNVEPLVELLHLIGAEAVVADPGRPCLAPFAKAVAAHFTVDELHPDAEHPRLTLLSLRP